MEQEVDTRVKDSQDAKCCTLDLPRLKHVHIICRDYTVYLLGEFCREAIRKWFGKESLDVVFEAGLNAEYEPPASVWEARELFEDYWQDIE